SGTIAERFYAFSREFQHVGRVESGREGSAQTLQSTDGRRSLQADFRQPAIEASARAICRPPPQPLLCLATDLHGWIRIRVLKSRSSEFFPAGWGWPMPVER